MSLSEASFIAALIATGGIVAWIGDIVGYRLGKRRVSLFGIRPRATAVIVGILSGALISTVTIAALSLTSKHVRTALFDMDRLDAELQDRKDEIIKQGEQIERHKQAVDEAEQRRAEAEQREAKARADVDRLETDIEQKRRSLASFRADLARVRQLQGQTEAENQELEAKAQELVAKIRKAEDGLATAQIVLARQRAILVRVATGLEFAHYEDPVIEAQEELSRGVIDAARPTPEVRAAVMQLLEEASGYAAQKGAGTGENNGRAVLYVALPIDDASEQDVLPEPQAIDQFVATILARGHKSLAVRAIARLNAWRGEQATVVLEDKPNMLVFAKGEVAGDLDVDSSWADVQLYQAIMALLTIEVRLEARQRRMLTVPNDKKYGSIQVPEIFAAMDEIHARRGLVTIEAVVAEDTWTVGPLTLDLRLAGTETDERVGRSPDAPTRAGG